jgi:outer membrane beta-barrel protein
MRKALLFCALLSAALPTEAFAGDAHPAVVDQDGVAQEEEETSEDDELGDILGTGSGAGSTVQDEIDAVRSGELGDNVGARQEDVVLVDDSDRKKRLIKTIQRKTFLKLGRWEIAPHVAFVANDPFLNRYIVGSGIGYHLTEIFAIEANIDFSPDLGTADWKPLTKQLVEENHVSPDISKLTFFGNVSFQFSPIYGKAALMGRNIINFDIYGAFGMGATRTADDLEALQAQEDPRAIATQIQVHPTTNYGGGARIIFNENLALRVEARSMLYIETVNATTLEMKQNLLIQAAVSFFVPGIRG